MLEQCRWAKLADHMKASDRGKNRPVRIAAWTILLVSTSLPVACVEKEPLPGAGPSKTYRHAMDGAPGSLDPARASSIYANFLALNLYDTLYRYRYLARPYELTPNLADGMPEELAWDLVILEFLDGLLPVASLSRELGIAADQVGEAYFGLASDIDFPWLQDCLARLPGADSWEPMAARALGIDLEAARRTTVRGLLRSEIEGSTDIGDAMRRFRTGCEGGLRRIGHLIEELKESGEPSLAALTVAVHSISDQCREWSEESP